MKDQLWDLNQTWPVGLKWCRFTNTLYKFWARFGVQKYIKFWTTFCDFSTPHRISPERNAASTNKTASSIYNVSPASWPTFRDRWPRNSWDPFAYFDQPFGGPSLVFFKFLSNLNTARCAYSTRLTRGQHATQPACISFQCYEDGHTCFITHAEARTVVQ